MASRIDAARMETAAAGDTGDAPYLGGGGRSAVSGRATCAASARALSSCAAVCLGAARLQLVVDNTCMLVVLVAAAFVIV